MSHKNQRPETQGSTFDSADPGLGEKYAARTKRVINKDGSFNVNRVGTDVQSIYQRMINMSWGRFILIVILFYIVFNSFFAILYLMAGVEDLEGMQGEGLWDHFLYAFFFSVQTFTTVGYGGIFPKGILVNIISTFEAMTGLLGFALATGIMYGRFSKPSSKIRYSKNVLIVNRGEVKELQFRIANRRTNVLMEMEAKVLLKLSDSDEDSHNRTYYDLNLQMRRIYFFPLNWTIVHKIDKESPLYGFTEQDLIDQDAELLILIKGFDDTFSQFVHSRYSYQHHEMIWNARFEKAFHIEEDGMVYFDINKIDHYKNTHP